MSTDKTLVIAIGRNIGNLPMRARRWNAFKNSLQGVASEYGKIVSRARGTGVYEGVLEQTYVLIVSAPTDEFGNVNLVGIKTYLRALAEAYEQESIALVVGHTTFVGKE